MNDATKTAQTTVWIMEIKGEQVHIIPHIWNDVSIMFRGARHGLRNHVSLPPSAGMLECIAEDIWYEHFRGADVDCAAVAKATISQSREATADEVIATLTVEPTPERYTDPCGRLFYHNQRSPE